jgi:hypothetical protein
VDVPAAGLEAAAAEAHTRCRRLLFSGWGGVAAFRARLLQALLGTTTRAGRHATQLRRVRYATINALAASMHHPCTCRCGFRSVHGAQGAYRRRVWRRRGGRRGRTWRRRRRRRRCKHTHTHTQTTALSSRVELTVWHALPKIVRDAASNSRRAGRHARRKANSNTTNNLLDKLLVSRLTSPPPQSACNHGRSLVTLASTVVRRERVGFSTFDQRCFLMILLARCKAPRLL